MSSLIWLRNMVIGSVKSCLASKHTILYRSVVCFFNNEDPWNQPLYIKWLGETVPCPWKSFCMAPSRYVFKTTVTTCLDSVPPTHPGNRRKPSEDAGISLPGSAAGCPALRPCLAHYHRASATSLASIRRGAWRGATMWARAGSER